MKQYVTRLCLLAVLCLTGIVNLCAHDFEEGGIYYKKLTATTCEVTFEGFHPEKGDSYRGNVVIPEQVTNDGTTYDVTAIGGYAFKGCTDLTSVTMPNSVISIGESAFWTCISLPSITLSNSLTTIEKNAFDYCTGIESFTLPGGLRTIGDGAFCNCKALTTVNIPSSVESIGHGVFDGCKKLPVIDGIRYADCIAVEAIDKDQTTYSIKEGTRFIHSNAFLKCHNLTSIVIPHGVKEIGMRAFEYCRALTSVSIPSTVTRITESAFIECSSLPSITIPEGVRIMEYQVFFNCNALATVNIPSTVTSIERYVFEFCHSLTSITIPHNVKSIDSQAFKGCSNLKSIYVEPETPPTVGANCFDGVNKDIPVYVRNAAAAASYKAANGWKEFTSYDSFDKELTLEDKKPYLFTIDFTVQDLTYTRSFSNPDVWQCWYVPFDVKVDESKFKAAEIAGILFDSQRNAVVAFNKLDDGATLKANTPYVVKSVRENLELKLSDVPLHAAKQNTFSIQSAYDNYTFGGVYTAQSNSDWYSLNKSGNFQKMGSATLQPQRFWMSATPRTDGPYTDSDSSAQGMPVIKMVVLGDDDPTSIERTPTSINNDNTLYNLQGQKVSTLQSGRIYIMNGKKVMIK